VGGSRRGHWQDCILTGLGRYLHSGFPRQTVDGKAKVPRKIPAIWELGQVRSLLVSRAEIWLTFGSASRGLSLHISKFALGLRVRLLLPLAGEPLPHGRVYGPLLPTPLRFRRSVSPFRFLSAPNRLLSSEIRQRKSVAKPGSGLLLAAPSVSMARTEAASVLAASFGMPAHRIRKPRLAFSLISKVQAFRI
jgi:hypothetical protein